MAQVSPETFKALSMQAEADVSNGQFIHSPTGQVVTVKDSEIVDYHALALHCRVTEDFLGKALNGTLTIQTRSRRTVDYEVTTPPEEDREIVVEEARVPGWTPAAGTGGLEETPTRYRHTMSARKGATAKASFVTERLDSERVVLTELKAEDMLVRIAGHRRHRKRDDRDEQESFHVSTP